MITIKDIAKKAGVAVSTVSYSLNNDPRIPDTTKHRVLEVASQLGYQGKSGHKSGSGYTKQIVLCLNTISGEIYSNIVNSIKKVLKVNNCELLVYIGKDINKLKWLDGIFVLNSQVEVSAIKDMAQRKIPVVIMDRKLGIDGTVSVTLNNFQGMYDVTKAIITKGSKTFAFVGGPSSSYESQERHQGFIQALSDNMLQSWDIHILQSDFTYEGGINVSHYFLELSKMPDAIICANDEMAMGLIDGLIAKDAGIMDKIRITGFDGLKPKSNIPYITARAETAHWGSMSAYSMIQCFEHIKMEKNITIPVELVEYY